MTGLSVQRLMLHPWLCVACHMGRKPHEFSLEHVTALASMLTCCSRRPRRIERVHKMKENAQMRSTMTSKNIRKPLSPERKENSRNSFSKRSQTILQSSSQSGKSLKDRPQNSKSKLSRFYRLAWHPQKAPVARGIHMCVFALLTYSATI